MWTHTIRTRPNRPQAFLSYTLDFTGSYSIFVMASVRETFTNVIAQDSEGAAQARTRTRAHCLVFVFSPH